MFLNAQTEEINYFLPSEDNIFNQSDLIFEGNLERCVATYNAKGNGYYNDIYSIYEYRVRKVYKGDISLAGSTILMVFKGGVLGDENFPWDSRFNDDSRIIIPEQKEKGIPSIPLGTFSPAIIFSVNSDYPDDENSKYFQEKKYRILDKIFVQDDYVASFKEIPFSDVVEMHNWMKQFNGYNFAEIKMERKPKQNWVNGAELEADILDTEFYENQKKIMNSINNEALIEIEKDSKKKNKKIKIKL